MAISRSGVVLGILVAGVLALVGGALASWRAWEMVSPLPTAAEFAELGRLISPDDPGSFTRADPVRDDIADTGTVVPVETVPDPNRSIDPIRDRMKAGGWRIDEEAHDGTETYFVAVRGHLRVFVIDEYWSDGGGGGGGGLSAKVLREPTALVTLAGWAGALVSAAIGFALVARGDHRTRGRRFVRAALVLLTGATIVLLIPALAWTVYRMLPDGVTIAHNYVQEPFWRGLTGEPRAVPALYPAALALLLLVVPFPRPKAVLDGQPPLPAS